MLFTRTKSKQSSKQRLSFFSLLFFRKTIFKNWEFDRCVFRSEKKHIADFLLCFSSFYHLLIYCQKLVFFDLIFCMWFFASFFAHWIEFPTVTKVFTFYWLKKTLKQFYYFYQEIDEWLHHNIGNMYFSTFLNN